MSSMFARGGESDYNLVLIDGVRVNQSGGAFDFSRIGAAEIDRVEVVRGAQSSLWGSDAMGSVVQIFTQACRCLRRAARHRGDRRRIVRHLARRRRHHRRRAGARRLPRRGQHSTDRRRVCRHPAGGRPLRADGVRPRRGRRPGTSGEPPDGPAVQRRQRPERRAHQLRVAGTPAASMRADDLSWHVDGAHAVGAWYTGTASFNYFRYDSLSADTIADPAFGTYTILEGTPNALFPNGPRLVRTIDQPEFLALSAAGALPAPGQFLASQLSSDYPFDSESAFRRPGVPVPGRRGVGRRPAPERRVRVGAGVEPADRRPFARQQRVLRAAAGHLPAIDGSPPSAGASTARRATTRSSAPSCRRAASCCRSAAAGCRR